MYPLVVLYEDADLIAVHKPSGLLVHRTYLARKEKWFALQMVRDYVGAHVFPIHRLDRPTSGVLLFAKSSEIARSMCEMMQRHEVQKTYYAIVRGYFEQEGTLDYPLREELDKIADAQAQQDKEAQEAITKYQGCCTVEIPFPSTTRYPTSRFSLVRLEPKTGRKHQLRRHMAHLRHPIIGDTTHGDGKQNIFFKTNFACNRLLLIAKSMRFIHPLTQKTIEIVAPFDPVFEELAQKFHWDLNEV